jgi:uncharacterized damage-inducible protein DinB
MEKADREILEHIVRTREKTISLFDRVPEDWLSKKAKGESKSLGGLFIHIADGSNWWMNYCMQDGLNWKYPGSGSFDKASIRAALEKSMDRLISFFETGDGKNMDRSFELDPQKRKGDEKWTGRNRILYLADHEVHHRGKILLSLRQWGMREFPFMPF